MEYDAFGRLVKTVANVVENDNGSDANLTVEYAYNDADQLAEMTVANAATGPQTTRYEYGPGNFGLGSDLQPNRNDLLVKEIFPDYTDGSLIERLWDFVTYGYNRLGEVTYKCDQNGTAHQYEYDDLGRLVEDRVVALGTGIDGTVRRIGVAYTAHGSIETVTSYDQNDAVANQILYEYDENGLLSREYTGHDGAVDTQVTPYVGYEYDTVENLLRLKAQVYPGGKRVEYVYDNAGRVTAIEEDGDTVVEYVDRGFATTNGVSYPLPGLTLDCSPQTLDGFDRIVKHAWKNTQGTALVDLRHDYDVAGNRLNRSDMVRTNASETYTYDRLDQLKSLQRGSHNEAWGYDPTGNWISYVRNNTTQNRTHNAANEILNNVTNDDVGNMTEILGVGTLRYDAWNRLVAVGENIRYVYDGLNRRIKKTVGNAVTRSFFNADWQEVESRKGNAATAYVWGLRYVDDLVSREKDDVRFYALQDANWNVVALTDVDGVVLERYTYDGFGKRTALLDSGITFDRAFTGQVLDAETGLMCYRNRYYSTSLGRFLTRDPIGYMAGDPNLYGYVFNNGLFYVDPSGLQFGFSPVTELAGGQGYVQAQMGLARPSANPLPRTKSPATPKPTPRFYVVGRIVEPGPGFGRTTAHAIEGVHTDIFHLELGKIYEGWYGPPEEKQSLPSGPNWEIYPLERFTELEIVTATPLLLPHGGVVSVTTLRSEKATIAWGPAKGKLCEDATEAEIIACIQEKPVPKGIPTAITNCQTDTQDAITGCCLKGFTGMGLGPTTLRHEIKGAK